MSLKYHNWATSRLFELLENVSEQHYHASAKLAFRSIHGTLNHLIVAEQLWIKRIKNENCSELTRYWKNPEKYGYKNDLKIQFEDIYPSKEATHQAYLELLKELENIDYEGRLTYCSTNGNERSTEKSEILYHIVNHGTHHRGQISAALTQFGYAPPELDYIYFISK
eukprot:NODE_56_length_28873_cov_1.243101.p14 type:complete len:167 gc:universal NODE_56_length_28873_cov_1.243101:12520-12020(-)